MRPTDTIDDDRLLTTADVATRYGVHVKTVSKLVEDGKIPPPVEESPTSERRWLLSEIVADIRRRRRAAAQELVR